MIPGTTTEKTIWPFTLSELGTLVKLCKERASWIELKRKLARYECFLIHLTTWLLFLQGSIDVNEVPETPVEDIIKETMRHMDVLYHPNYWTRRRTFANLIVTLFDPSKDEEVAIQPSRKTSILSIHMEDVEERSAEQQSAMQGIGMSSQAILEERIELSDYYASREWPFGRRLPCPTYHDDLESSLALQPSRFVLNKLAMLDCRLRLMGNFALGWQSPSAGTDRNETYKLGLENSLARLQERIAVLENSTQGMGDDYRATLKRNVEALGRAAQVFIARRHARRHDIRQPR